MKRIILCVLTTISVLMLWAQTQDQTSTSTPTQVISLAPTTTFHTDNASLSTNQDSRTYMLRSGQHYIYKGDAMNEKAYAAFLEKNCPAAYQQYRSGRNVNIAGWTLFGSGIAIDAGLIIGALVTGNTNQLNSKRLDNVWAVTFFSGTMIFCASLPTLLVGYSRKYRSVDTFNLACRPEDDVTAYWTIQADENGLGLALHF